MKKTFAFILLCLVAHNLNAQTIISAGDYNSGYVMPMKLWLWSYSNNHCEAAWMHLCNSTINDENDYNNVFCNGSTNPTVYGIAFVYLGIEGIIEDQDNNLSFRMYTKHDDSFELIESVKFKDTVFNNKYLRIPKYLYPRFLNGLYLDTTDYRCNDTAWYEVYFDTCTYVGDTLFKLHEIFFKRGHTVTDSCYAVGAYLNTIPIWHAGEVFFLGVSAFPCSIFMQYWNGVQYIYSRSSYIHDRGHQACIFPITSREIWLEHVTQHCGPVGTPMVVMSDDRTIACWVDTNDHCLYELAYGPTGIPTDSLTTLTSQFKSVLLTDLIPGTEYTFRVRGQCCYEDTIIVWSNWSDTIHFSLPQTGIGTAASPSLQITPNPAKERVTVASDEPILLLTLTDMQGRTITELQPDSDTATVGIENCSPGTYLVRIATNHGTAVKKLVIE